MADLLVDLFPPDVGVVGEDLLGSAVAEGLLRVVDTAAAGVGPRPVALGVDPLGRFEDRAARQVGVEDAADDLRFLGVGDEGALALGIQVIADDLSAVPQAALRSGQERGPGALARLFALELVERSHDRDEAFALGRRGVEVLLEADEVHLVLFEEVDHVQEVAGGAADAGEGGTDDGIDSASLDILDHAQVRGTAFDVLGGFALIDVAVHNDPRLRADFTLELSVLSQELVLVLEGALLDLSLPVGGHSDVEAAAFHVGSHVVPSGHLGYAVPCSFIWYPSTEITQLTFEHSAVGAAMEMNAAWSVWRGSTLPG